MPDDPHNQPPAPPAATRSGDHAPVNGRVAAAVEAPGHLERHDPPTRITTAAAAAARTRPPLRGPDVTWVRASEVLAHGAGRVAGYGIRWSAAAHRWPRLPPPRPAATGRRAIANAAVKSRLAPVTAFGAGRRSGMAPAADPPGF